MDAEDKTVVAVVIVAVVVVVVAITETIVLSMVPFPALSFYHKSMRN